MEMSSKEYGRVLAYARRYGNPKERAYATGAIILIFALVTVIATVNFAIFPVFAWIDKRFRFTKKYFLISALWCATILPIWYSILF